MFERPKEEPLPNGTKESSPPPDVPLKTHLTGIAENTKPPSSPLVHTSALPEDGEEEMGYPEQSKQLLTAIYRPESKSAWRQELQTANERAEQVSRFIVLGISADDRHKRNDLDLARMGRSLRLHLRTRKLRMDLDLSSYGNKRWHSRGIWT
jgi:hypothetical protein